MKTKIFCIIIMTLFITTAIPIISGTEINKMISPGVTDQKQTDTSETDFLENGVPHWQQFINHGNMIEEVDVHIGCWYSGSADITLSIRETVGGSILTKKTHKATDLPDNHQDWFTFDVDPNIKLQPNKMYYIVIEFGGSSEYEWSGAHGDPYPAGVSSHPDWDWDYAFITTVDKKSKTISYEIENYPLIFQMFQKFFNNSPIFAQIL